MPPFRKQFLLRPLFFGGRNTNPKLPYKGDIGTGGRKEEKGTEGDGERERLFCHGVLRERKGLRFPACPLIDHRREERHAEGVRSQVGVTGGATG